MARICIQNIKINSSLVSNTAQIKLILIPTAIPNQEIKFAADIINTKAHKKSIKLNNTKLLNLDLVYEFVGEFSLYVFFIPNNNKRSMFKLLDYCKMGPSHRSPGSNIVSVENAFTVDYFVETEEDKIYVDGEVSEFVFSLDRAECVKITETRASGGDEIYFEVQRFKTNFPNAIQTLTFPNTSGYYRFKQNGVIHDFDTIKITFNKEEYIRVRVWEKDLGRGHWLDKDDHLSDFIINPGSNQIQNKSVHIDADSGAYNFFYSISPKKPNDVLKKRGKDGYTKSLTSITPHPNFQSFFDKMEQLNSRLTAIVQPSALLDLSSLLPGFDGLYNYMISVEPENNEDTDRINEFIDNYYDEFLNNPDLKEQYIEELTHSQYPIMAYPVFPEPAYYYLKKLSNKFILPAVEAMPMNSMALFVNNPEFVEAFLCGMNTEMGRELLWREYPTDSRGSYFRKFWDTELKKNIAEELKNNSLFDVLPLHQWESAFSEAPQKPHHLGENHTKGKDNLLIFAVKGDLLKKYPDTVIFLSQAKLDGQEIKINPDGAKLLPDLSAWLSHDTYIVGFPIKLQDITGDPATKDPGFFLTFMNKPSETRFRNIPAGERSTMLPETNAAVRSVNELVHPCIFGKHVSQFLTGWTLKK